MPERRWELSFWGGESGSAVLGLRTRQFEQRKVNRRHWGLRVISCLVFFFFFYPLLTSQAAVS